MEGIPQPSRPQLALSAVAEVVALSLLAVGLSALLPLPWLPRVEEAAFPLRARTATAADRVPEDELVRRIRAIPGVGDAEVLLERGGKQLVLRETDVVSDGWDRPILEVLEPAGYQRVTPELREVFDANTLKDHGWVLPLVLSWQVVVFLTGGLAMSRIHAMRGTSLDARAPFGRSLLWAVGGGVAALALTLALAGLLQAVGLPVEEQPWVVELESDPAAMARLSPWLVVLGPLSEEVFFRLYAFRLVRRHAGFPTALLVSSALFAVLHFNLSGLLVYLLVGCVFGWLYERTGRFLTPLGAHFVYNALVIVLGLYRGPEV